MSKATGIASSDSQQPGTGGSHNLTRTLTLTSQMQAPANKIWLTTCGPITLFSQPISAMPFPQCLHSGDLPYSLCAAMTFGWASFRFPADSSRPSLSIILALTSPSRFKPPNVAARTASARTCCFRGHWGVSLEYHSLPSTSSVRPS